MNRTDVTSSYRIRSYVRRQGRVTSGQRSALERLWSKYGLDFEHCDESTIKPDASPIILEIGFGNGESLVEMASKHPDYQYLGVDVYVSGVGHLLLTLERREIKNVKIFLDDALNILEHCIEDDALTGINLFFPDPWPKQKHHKRRLVTADFTELIARKLKVKGLFHVATDWQHYADQIGSVIGGSGYFINVSEESGFQHILRDRPQTKFERRGVQLGHKVWNLMFGRGTGGPAYPCK